MFQRILSSLRKTATFLAILAAMGSSAGFTLQAAEVFDPNADGNVYAMLRQPDGKFLAAGSFHFLNPNSVGQPWDRRGIVRLHPDGTVDHTFWAEFDGPVHSIALQDDGKVIAAGRFTTVRSLTSQEPVARNGIARLEANGGLDLSFDPNPQGTSYPQPLVRSLFIQDDGKILVGGAFTGFMPNGAGTAVDRSRIARLNEDGTVDNTFDPNADGLVLAITMQRDGKILVGGAFTSWQPNGGEVVETGRLARLNADGTVDQTLDVRPDNRVTGVAVMADSSIMVAGDFLSVEINGASAISQPRLFRLQSDGTFDGSFRPVPNGPVSSMAVQSDGKVLLGGKFSFIYSPSTGLTTARNFIARLNPDGTVDGSFSVFPSGEVAAFVAQPDGSIVIGGYFTTVIGTGSSESVIRRRLARLQSNGAVDSGFSTATDGTINSVVRTPDGGLVAGGSFQNFVGVSRDRIVKLLPDNGVDPDFDPVFSDVVNVVGVQSDGKILVGGAFTRVESLDIPYLARLNADGTVDETFQPTPNGSISALVVQPDGKIVIGGQFTQMTPNGSTEPVTRNFIARLNSDGSVDTAFNPNVSNLVEAIALLSDGSMYIGGYFRAIRPNGEGESVVRTFFAKIGSNGTLIEDFDVQFSNVVTAIAVQPDGDVVVGGSFSGIVPDGATEAIERNGIVRITPEGAVDETFDPSPNSTVSDIVIMADGRIQIAGNFTSLQPNDAETTLVRQGFAWLEADGTSPDSLDYQFANVVTALVADGDAAIVGGAFSSLKTPDGIGVLAGSGLVRLRADASLDDEFQPNAGEAISGEIGAIAVQNDGKIIFGGDFSRIAGSSSTNLMRIGSDGSADPGFFSKPDGPVNAVLSLVESELVAEVGGPAAMLDAEGGFLAGFNPGFLSQLSGTVRAIVRQPDGKVLVGGVLDNSGGPGFNLYRFNADGTQDLTFLPEPAGTVNAIALQSDGKIIIGGTFLTVGAVDRRNLARLNADGSLDTEYNPSPNSTVFSIVMLSDDRHLVGGSFSGFALQGAEETTSRQFLARLDAEGALDGGFAPTPNGHVSDIELLADGRLLVAGSFTSFNGVSRRYFVRLSAEGGLDEGFDPRPNAVVNTIALQSDGKMVIGGAFFGFTPNGGTDTEAENVSQNYLARVNDDGSIDEDFTTTPNAEVTAVDILSDGRILVGGSFTLVYPDLDSDFLVRNGLARLLPTGEIDPNYNPLPNGSIATISVFDNDEFAVGGAYTSMFPEPTIAVGGEFQNFSESSAPYLARIYNNGVVDTSFRETPNGPVYALAAQLDRQMIAAGAFTQIGETARNRIVRFGPNGTVDASFDPDADGTVRAVAVLPDGKILVGGEFTTVGGVSAMRIARLNADGSVDNTFAASIDGTVYAIAEQSDGKIVVSGDFQNVNLISRPYLARLNIDGTLDGSFNPAPDGPVWTVSVQGDGNLVVGGDFTSIAGSSKTGIARLTPGGAIDGSLGTTTNGSVYAVAPQFDGSMIIGGAFTSVSGQSRSLFAKLTSTGVASLAFSVTESLDAVTFNLGGNTSDLASANFSYSDDSNSWSSLGAGQRTGQPGEWTIGGLNLPGDAFYFIRVEGLVTNNRYGSGDSRQFISQFFGADPVSNIFSDQGGGSPSGGGQGGSSSGSGGGTSGGGSSGGGGSGGSGSGENIDVDTISAPAFGVVNLSGRGVPSDETPLITGFVVAGAGPQHLLLRAVGPGLEPHGVGNVLLQPVIRLFDASGGLIAETTGWNGSDNMPVVFDKLGAFQLDPEKSDAVLFTAVVPGAYTVHVAEIDGEPGIALNEIYLAAVDGSESGSLANVSLRGHVGLGDEVLVAGFNVDAEGPQPLLVRGLGPVLRNYGISEAITDPVLRIYDAEGVLVAENDDWDLQVDYTAGEMAEIMTLAGAFALEAGGADSAAIVTLQPGSYTIQVSAETPGTALIEVYDAP